MKLPLHEIKKIAVFRALQLGDMLCVIPALRALHHACAEARITLLGLPWASCLTERFPHYIHQFIHFPGYPGLPEQPVQPGSFSRFLSQVQEEEYDLVLQMQGNGSIVNPMVMLLGARFTAGFCLPDDYYPDNGLFLPYPEGLHEIERHLQLMRFLGIEPAGTELEFPVSKNDEEQLQALGWELRPGQYVCIHPGSRGKHRQWPPAYFATVANYCASQGLQVVITGTKEEMNIVEEVANQIKGRVTILAGRTSLGVVAALIRDARLLVSNCTGVSHMAAAFATPSVVISMDGEPGRWGPLNREVHRTIDWTRCPDPEAVFHALKDLLRLQRDHIGNETIAFGIQQIPKGQ